MLIHGLWSMIYGGVPAIVDARAWIVYGKSINGWFGGTPNFRKPPHIQSQWFLDRNLKYHQNAVSSHQNISSQHGPTKCARCLRKCKNIDFWHTTLWSVILLNGKKTWIWPKHGNDTWFLSAIWIGGFHIVHIGGFPVAIRWKRNHFLTGAE